MQVSYLKTQFILGLSVGLTTPPCSYTATERGWFTKVFRPFSFPGGRGLLRQHFREMFCADCGDSQRRNVGVIWSVGEMAGRAGR